MEEAGAADDDDDRGGPRAAAEPGPDAALPLPAPTDPDFVYPPTAYPPPSTFETVRTHPAIIVPARRTAELRRSLKHVLLGRPKVKDVYPLEQGDTIEGGAAAEDGGEAERKLVLKLPSENDGRDPYDDPSIASLLSDEPNARRSTHDLTTSYESLTVDQTLKLLLPADSVKEVPSSFEIVGHVAHLNLRDDALPYKHLVGRCILDKNRPRIKVVVNKIGTIENEFRTFPMEIIAGSGGGGGEDSKGNNPYEVEVKEEGCAFELDFGKVYWNSRLGGEHRRIVSTIADTHGDAARRRRLTSRDRRTKKKKKKSDDDDATPAAAGGREAAERRRGGTEADGTQKSSFREIVVADVMAGVGPFAVPLTSRYNGITVHANDLNPVSYRYLRRNAELNKCGNNLKPYNLDGRAFVRDLDDRGVAYDHVIMNLPASAPEFLDAFRGWTPPPQRVGSSPSRRSRPRIHVHCFAPKDPTEAKTEAVERCRKALGCPLDESVDEVCVRDVRDVSPKKNMYCVSFLLPEGVKDVKRLTLGEGGGEGGATAGGGGGGEADSPAPKKSRVE